MTARRAREAAESQSQRDAEQRANELTDAAAAALREARDAWGALGFDRNENDCANALRLLPNQMP